MDTQALIEKYKNQVEKQYYLLDGGRVVVGQEVDENNQAWYVIRDQDTYTVESAWNQVIVETFTKNTTSHTRIDIGTALPTDTTPDPSLDTVPNITSIP